MTNLIANRYLVHELLGEGRVSTVHRATDTTDGSTVALKVFSPIYIRGAQSLSCLSQEIASRTTISHPNIIKILGKGACEVGLKSTLYLVLEYVQGATTLANRIAKLNDEPLSFQQIIKLLLDVVSALSYLHERAVCITDLAPRRLILTEQLKVKLPAFGFITLDPWMRELSQFGSYSGVDYRYVAPETIHKAGVTAGDQKSDIYLFGLLAFELSCGTVPFEADKQTMAQLHRTEPVPDTLLTCGLPAWFDVLVKRCLHKEPERRPPLAAVRRILSENLAKIDDCELIVPHSVRRSKIAVLFVEDNKLDQLSLARFAKVESYPFQYAVATSVEQAKRLLEGRNFDVIVSDFLLPDGTAKEIIDLAEHRPVIVVTSLGKQNEAITALRDTVFEYVPKDIRHQHLKNVPLLVKHAFNHSQLVKQRDALSAQLSDERQSHKIAITKSEEVKELLRNLLAQQRNSQENLDIRDLLLESLNSLEATLKALQETVHESNSSMKHENSNFLLNTCVRDDNGF